MEAPVHQSLFRVVQEFGETDIVPDITARLQKFAIQEGLVFGEESVNLQEPSSVLLLDVDEHFIIVSVMEVREGYGYPLYSFIRDTTKEQTWAGRADTSPFLHIRTPSTNSGENLEKGWHVRNIAHDNIPYNELSEYWGFEAVEKSTELISNQLSTFIAEGVTINMLAAIRLLVDGAHGVSCDLAGKQIRYPLERKNGNATFETPAGAIFAANKDPLESKFVGTVLEKSLYLFRVFFRRIL